MTLWHYRYKIVCLSNHRVEVISNQRLDVNWQSVILTENTRCVFLSLDQYLASLISVKNQPTHSLPWCSNQINGRKEYKNTSSGHELAQNVRYWLNRQSAGIIEYMNLNRCNNLCSSQNGYGPKFSGTMTTDNSWLHRLALTKSNESKRYSYHLST